MTAGELIEELRNVDPSTEVRVATQPNYPLEAYFEGVVAEGSDVWLAVGETFGYDVPDGLHGVARRGYR